MIKRLTKKEILSIVNMRAKGMTGRSIAHELGVKERAIYYWVKRLESEGIACPTFNKRGGKKIKLT